jgi:hypothetical protein
MNGNSSTWPEEASATGRPDRDPLATQDDPAKFLTQDIQERLDTLHATFLAAQRERHADTVDAQQRAVRSVAGQHPVLVAAGAAAPATPRPGAAPHTDRPIRPVQMLGAISSAADADRHGWSIIRARFRRCAS